jgi:quercetin dioxygenase-like cupin family protein
MEHRRRSDVSLALDSVEWAPDVPGIRAREAEVDGARWALVEYEPGARREEWCRDGHAGYVVSGAIEYEFHDEETPVLSASEGQAFSLATGRGHRGRNLADGPTRLFLVDEPEA